MRCRDWQRNEFRASASGTSLADSRFSCYACFEMDASRELYAGHRGLRQGALEFDGAASHHDGREQINATTHGRPKDELDSEDIRQHRRMRYGAAAVILALAMLGPATLYWLWQARQQSALAALNWRDAESRHLAADAMAKAADGDGVHDAIVVALMAWRLAPTDEARRALATIEQASSGMARILGRHTRGVAALAFSGDGTRFATRGKDGSVLVWNTVDWTQDGGLLPGGRSNEAGCGGSHPNCNVAAVTFSPTGSHLLVWDRSGAMDFWDLRTRASQTMGEFERPGTVLRSAVIRADGALVAVGGDAGLLVVWEPSSGQLRRAPGSLAGWDVTGVHFAPDGRVLALASKHHAGARLAVWQLAAGQLTLGPPAELPGADRYAEVASFNTSGTRVLMLGHIGSTLAEVGPGGRLRDLTAMARDFRAERASLALDGRVVFAQQSLNEWRRWDFGSIAPMVVAQGTVKPPWTKLTWSPDARWRAEQDREDIRVWDAASHTAVGPAKVIRGSCELRTPREFEPMQRRVAWRG